MRIHAGAALISPTPTVVGEGCVGQKRPVPADGPAGTDHSDMVIHLCKPWTL